MATSNSEGSSTGGGGGSFKYKTQLARQENYKRQFEDEEILQEEKGTAEHVRDKLDYLVEGMNRATRKSVRRQKKLDTRVKHYIRNNYESGPLDRLRRYSTLKEILSKLQQAYGLLGFTLIQGFLNILATLNNANNKSTKETINHFHKAV